MTLFQWCIFFFRDSTRCRRYSAVAGGVLLAAASAPVLAALAVAVGVPVLLAYIYGVVPVSLCRAGGGCDGVNEEDEEDANDAAMQYTKASVANPSIGDVSLGASLSLGSALDADQHAANPSTTADRESASNTAVAGTSRTVSLASGYDHSLLKPQLRLEADVHASACGSARKRFFESLDRLSSGDAASVTSGAGQAASTKALAGSLLAADNGSMASVGTRANTGRSLSTGVPAGTSGDELSLRSLPVAHAGPTTQRSLSPVSQLSGDELAHSGRRSKRQQKLLDRQMSENSSLLGGEDAASVRFDENVSFIDNVETAPASAENKVRPETRL